MQKTQSKVISISDLIQWSDKQELELSPKYQRNMVWNENAKAYLIDTIIRGLPIPPIFLRQKVDVATKKTFREVVDGQQRVRAILEFAADYFPIQKKHNTEYGGMKYSDLDSEIQEAFLQYEIFAQTVVEKDDGIIYDMFARLNSNNIVLNTQEIRNSKYWGDFKVLIYRLSSDYRDFLLSYKLISDSDCARMKDSELMNSIVLLANEGIIGESPKVIDSFYKKYDVDFKNSSKVYNEITDTMGVLEEVYEYYNGNMGCFINKNYFFTLFCVVYNQMYGIKDAELPRNSMFDSESIRRNIQAFENYLSDFINDYDRNIADKDNIYGKYAEYSEFAKNHSTRTTSKNERTMRITLLNEAFGGEKIDC